MRSRGMAYSWSGPERCLFAGCTGGDLYIANCQFPIQPAIGIWQSAILLTLLKYFGVFQIIPAIKRGQRVMVSHVAAKRRHGHITRGDGVVISTLNRIRIEILFADPEVRLAARVDVFGNYRPRILDSLPRHLYAFDLARRDIDVE